MKNKSTIAIMDTETGGFSKTKNGVCEVAIIIVDEGLNEVQAEFSALIKPYTRADDTDELVSYKDDAMAIHGITVAELEKDGENVEVVMQKVVAFLEEHGVRTLLGHNLPVFDVPRVEHLTERFLKKDLKKYAKVCTLEKARKHLKATSYKLEDLCDTFNIEKKQSHRALSDCYSTLGFARLLVKHGFLTFKKIKEDAKDDTK